MRFRAAGLIVAAALLAGACGGGPEAQTIDDPQFTSAAQALCAEQLPPLRADITDDTPREPGEVAPVVDERADDLEAVVVELRRIDVDPAARAVVDGWFEDWDLYIDVGRRYADALRGGDPDEYSKVAAEGSEPQARISTFARTNDFEACALDGVPLPERESPI